MRLSVVPLHDALPIWAETGFASILDDQSRSDCLARNPGSLACDSDRRDVYLLSATGTAEYVGVRDILDPRDGLRRSEEHTSELQSRRDLVCRLLSEKK